MSDINKLGKELEIYTTVDFIGKGFPIILPRGARIIKVIRNYVEKDEEEKGYKIVRTPSLSNSEVYKIEDRYEIEKDKLFIIKKYNDDNEMNKNEIVLKPYVQPFHCCIFNEIHHSYKQLPIKYCETSTVYRNVKDIKGINRTRQITLSDASIFCEPDKVEREIKKAIEMQLGHIKKLGLDVTFTISTWDDEQKENYIGTIQEWNNLTQAMKNALDNLKIKYNIDKNARMYGPSIKIKYEEKDFSRLQIDFEITHRFNTKYTDKDNTEKFPIYIYHTVVGSYENLLSILIRKYNGEFPLWLSPAQAVIVGEREEFDDYCNKICAQIREEGIRASVDKSINNFNSKVERQNKLKIPYIITIGKNELNENTIKVIHNGEKICKVNEFIKEVKECQAQS